MSEGWRLLATKQHSGLIAQDRSHARNKAPALPGRGLQVSSRSQAGCLLMALSGLFERARRMSAFLKGHEGGSLELDPVQP